MLHSPHHYLKDLGLSDSEVTIYLAMTAGVRAARDLIKVTQLKRPTVYYALQSLEKRGLVSRTGKEGEQRLVLEPAQRLATIAEERMKDAGKLHDDIVAMLPSLDGSSGTTDRRPVVAFFEGVPAVRRMIMETLYCRGRHIDSVAPKNNFFWQIGSDFAHDFVGERVRRKIQTRNLWEGPVQKSLVDMYYKGLSEIRMIPPVMQGKFQTTIFLYDDKTLYIASKKNAYCVLITSQEHHDTMHAWFDGLWSASSLYKA